MEKKDTPDSVLVTDHGKTKISDDVVAKVAGMAAREIGGVHAMGSGMARTMGSMRERLPGGGGRNVAQGVSVQVGERQTAVDVDLVVDYGVSIPDLAGAVRENIINQVEHMTGLEVVEVNISVDDIHLPGDDNNNDDNDSGNGKNGKNTDAKQQAESEKPRVQ
ncbi:Asp23/Gls24 family envelope stress response protein [Actinomadura hibisca]|uniref:Asp23/Gls24 family envelope stress response protein n=1 Tax=Actinomadura hibisca TaxID=68565 RepID=UPI001FE12623|nr:Asp23/Gls24 family envelope stress response protein [Actinomadura hibisca]